MRSRSQVVLLVVFLLVNGIVLFNACLHDPTVGYDAPQYARYIETLARLHIPGLSDSLEYFSPPLPFILPALVVWSGVGSLWWGLKLAQFLNFLLSIGLTLSLLKLCDLVRPMDTSFKTVTLAILGSLPVYYKTFAFVRGEPFVAFFAVLTVYLTLLIFLKGDHRLRNLLALGGALGLAVNARQWGFLLFPPILLFAAILARKDLGRWKIFARSLAVILMVSVLIGAGFYLRLYQKYGTFTAFNREPEPAFALANQPPEFYFGLGNDLLFRDPIRPNYPNQFWPIFYSELWGDYWAHFTIYGRDTRTGSLVFGPKLNEALLSSPVPAWLQTNRTTLRAYLGRVNLISLFPTALLLAGFGLGLLSLIQFLRRIPLSPEPAAFALFALLIGALWLFYAWFLIQYPNLGKGDTIKATYVLQTFPFLAMLAAGFLTSFRQRWPLGYTLILIGLGLIAFHNLPAMLTHYTPWELFK